MKNKHFYLFSLLIILVLYLVFTQYIPNLGVKESFGEPETIEMYLTSYNNSCFTLNLLNSRNDFRDNIIVFVNNKEIINESINLKKDEHLVKNICINKTLNNQDLVKIKYWKLSNQYVIKENLSVEPFRNAEKENINMFSIAILSLLIIISLIIVKTKGIFKSTELLMNIQIFFIFLMLVWSWFI